MSRAARQEAILELLGQRQVSTQRQLAAELRDLGHVATQATLSRDLAALRVVRDHDNSGRLRYALAGEVQVRGGASEARLGEEMRRLALSVTCNDWLVVIRTEPGHANALAIALDRATWPELLGTVAGDDTIFVAVRRAGQVGPVMRRLQQLWKGERS